jgi:hypothetical protein
MPEQICEISASGWFYYKEICYDAARSRELKKMGWDSTLLCKSGNPIYL